jgi:hypothetical protein
MNRVNERDRRQWTIGHREDVEATLSMNIRTSIGVN